MTSLTAGNYYLYASINDGQNPTVVSSYLATPVFVTGSISGYVQDPNNGNVLSWKVPQARPTMGPSGTCDPLTGNSGHTGAIVVCLGDGSVRLVSVSISMKTWNAALTPATIR